MNKTLSMTAALLALTVGLASAAGLNLSWRDCGLNGDLNRNNLCTSNSGTHQLISSFVAPAGLTRVNGALIIVDMQTVGLTLSRWWNIASTSNPGGCRPGAALVFSNDFSAVPGTALCSEYFAASSGQGFNFPGEGGPNRQRFKHGHAITAGDPSIGAIAAGTEVYTSRIQISNAGTLPTTTCPGCLDDACIVLNEILVDQEAGAGGGVTIVNAADRNYVTWQGGEGTDCPGKTPTKKATWGTIKSLYR